MKCPRCHGLMVLDHFLDMQDEGGHLWLRVWRCVNCGQVTDPLIALHRQAPRSALRRLFKRGSSRPSRSPEVVRLSA